MGRQDGVARRRLVIRGRVQGVGFRYFVREYARELNVPGRVRNLPDGSVEIEVEAAADMMETIVAHLRRGPPGANVTDVEDVALEPGAPALPHPFTIER